MVEKVRVPPGFKGTEIDSTSLWEVAGSGRSCWTGNTVVAILENVTRSQSLSLPTAAQGANPPGRPAPFCTTRPGHPLPSAGPCQHVRLLLFCLSSVERRGSKRRAETSRSEMGEARWPGPRRGGSGWRRSPLIWERTPPSSAQHHGDGGGF